MKRSRTGRGTRSELSVMHPNAAAIDIGATMHMAAVSSDRGGSVCLNRLAVLLSGSSAGFRPLREAAG